MSQNSSYSAFENHVINIKILNVVPLVLCIKKSALKESMHFFLCYISH